MQTTAADAAALQRLQTSDKSMRLSQQQTSTSHCVSTFCLFLLNNLFILSRGCFDMPPYSPGGYKMMCYLLGDTHPPVGIDVSALQFGFHSLPHTDRVGVPLLDR